MTARTRLLPWFSLWLLVCALTSTPALAQDNGDFTVVVLPDTQNYSQSYPQIFTAQTQWIVDNDAAMNIQAVLGEGDIVNVGTDATQWANATNAIALLDQANIPYVLAIGNHDYDTLPPTTRSTTNYNQYFGPSRYLAKPYFGGSYPDGGTENMYATFTWRGKSYLVLALEYVPRAEAVAWAKSVLDANPDKEVIVVTHSYLYSDGTTVDQCDTDDMRGDYNGSALWSALISQYPNISVVVSGHITNKFFAHRDDPGVNGNFVHQIFANWQDWTNGGNGYLRLLRFSPADNTITVQSYSPFTGAYLTDPGDEFTLKWHNDGAPGSGTATVNGIVRNFAYGTSCERLSGVTVTVAGVTTTTDAKGQYTVQIPPGQVTATASQSGWIDGTQTVTLNDLFPNQVDFFLQSAAPCAQSAVDPSVTICTPAGNANVASPVNVVAGSNSSSAVQAMDIWLDGVKQYGVSAPQVNTDISMSDGTHRLTVQGRNAAGLLFKQTIYVTAGSPPPPPPPPPGPCSASTNVPSVNICTPANQANVTSPFTVQAAGNMANPIARIELWLDGTKVYQIAGAALDTQVTAADGTHRIVVQAADNTGATVKQTVYVNAGSPPASNCPPGSASPSVTVCGPANNSTVASPVNIVASTTDNAAPVTAVSIWVDGTKVWEQPGSQVNTSLVMAAGAHRVSVQARDANGTYFKSSVNVTVQ